jgi:hypothetical protein
MMGMEIGDAVECVPTGAGRNTKLRQERHRPEYAAPTELEKGWRTPGYNDAAPTALGKERRALPILAFPENEAEPRMPSKTLPMNFRK